MNTELLKVFKDPGSGTVVQQFPPFHDRHGGEERAGLGLDRQGWRGMRYAAEGKLHKLN